MVNAQEWLDENFPPSEESEFPGYEGLERNEIEVLNLQNSTEGINITLEGSLELIGFDNLEELDCWEQNLTRLDISQCPNLTRLNCAFNREITKLDLTNNPQLVRVDCRCNKITSLDCSNCPELEELVCLHNQLVKLNLSNCPELYSINFSHNHRKIRSFNLIGCNNLEEILGWDAKLTNLDFLNNLPCPEKIKCLELNWNKRLSGKLDCFSKFTNLESLYIDGSSFSGSLKPLQNLTKLRNLWISNTDIDSGLEYLPESITDFGCLVNEKKDAKCLTIANLLKDLKGEAFPQKLKEYKQKLAQKLPKDEPQEKTEATTQTSQEKIIPTKQTRIKPTLNHLLGKGGFGEVYYGKWKLQDAAVKKLYLSLDNISQKDLKEIMNEINILKSLKNRYIIQYYDTYSDDHEIFIIMDYAENGTLTKFINDNENKEHNWNLNNELIKQMASGLVYIHHENIIHRDLKSMNVLLTKGNQVKISDFGLSRTKIVSSSQSTHGNVGTLRWMAPELLKGEKYSEQSDIYALGMIIWEIVAKCTVPFKNVDNNLVGFRIISGEKETIPSDSPQNIQDIIQGCWKDNPSERISLISILGMVENDKANLQSITIHTKYASEFSNPSESWNSREMNNQSCDSQEIKLNISSFNNKTTTKESTGLTENFKRKLSLETQTKTNQGENKSIKVDKNLEYHSEPIPMEIDRDWTNIHFSFTPELQNQWQNLNFTYPQVQEWINIYSPNDQIQEIQYPEFYAWLRDHKNLTPEQILNDNTIDFKTLKSEFHQSQFQTQILQPTHNN